MGNGYSTSTSQLVHHARMKIMTQLPFVYRCDLACGGIVLELEGLADTSGGSAVVQIIQSRCSVGARE